MCHQLLCCFGTKEPDNRPPSRRQEQGPTSSPTKVPNSSVNGGSSPHVSSDINTSQHSNSPRKDSSAINGGADHSLDQQSNAPASQGECPQEVTSQDQNTEHALNGKIQDKPTPDSTQGKINPEEQAANNPNEQETGRSKKPDEEASRKPLSPKQQVHQPKGSSTNQETDDQKVSTKIACGSPKRNKDQYDPSGDESRIKACR